MFRPSMRSTSFMPSPSGENALGTHSNGIAQKSFTHVLSVVVHPMVFVTDTEYKPGPFTTCTFDGFPVFHEYPANPPGTLNKYVASGKSSKQKVVSEA